jgi:hypothetical protein
MKSIIALSAITALTALALVGCNQSNSTETPSSNSRMSDANRMMGGATNMMATNSMPNMDMPATNSMPNMDMPATNSMPSMDMPATNKTTGAANDATR